MLGVVPVHWDNPDEKYRELWHGDNPVYSSVCWIWKGTYQDNQTITEHGFWINANISRLKL